MAYKLGIFIDVLIGIFILAALITPFSYNTGTGNSLQEIAGSIFGSLVCRPESTCVSQHCGCGTKQVCEIDPNGHERCHSEEDCSKKGACTCTKKECECSSGCKNAGANCNVVTCVSGSGTTTTVKGTTTTIKTTTTIPGSKPGACGCVGADLYHKFYGACSGGCQNAGMRCLQNEQCQPCMSGNCGSATTLPCSGSKACCPTCWVSCTDSCDICQSNCHPATTQPTPTTTQKATTTTIKSSRNTGSLCRFNGGDCTTSCPSQASLGRMDCLIVCCKTSYTIY